MKLSLLENVDESLNDNLTGRKSLAKRKFKATKDDTFKQPKRQPYKREKYKHY
jgi:hypothetical protein